MRESNYYVNKDEANKEIEKEPVMTSYSIDRDFLNNCIEKNVNPKIDKIEKELDIVKDLDRQIAKLAYERQLILSSAERTGIELCDTKLTLMFDHAKLEKEYNKHGFRSNYVKGVVSRIRDVFFDDSKDEFKAYNCTMIDFYDDDIDFEFSNGNGYDIGISIPYKGYFDHGYCGSMESKYVFDNEIVNGKTSFYIRFGRDNTAIAYDYRYSAIKAAIEDYVLYGSKDTKQYVKDNKFKYSHYSLMEMVGYESNLNRRDYGD